MNPQLLSQAIEFVMSLFRKKAAEQPAAPATPPVVTAPPSAPARDPKVARQTNDMKLSEHFSLFSLTRTDHADLQAANRMMTDIEIGKLAQVAGLLEVFWEILGPMDVHSGKRGPALNARVGGSDKSQHLKCEAADCSPAGPDTEASIEAAFQKLVTAAKAGKFKFGQLIVEQQAKGREGRSYWIHVSLGAPHRSAERCGEILRMADGKYEVLAKVPQGAV